MNRKLILIFTLILVFVFIFWRGVLHQALLGEGFIYMEPEYAKMVLGYEGRTFLLTRYDVFPLLFFFYFGPVIRDSVITHMILMLFWLSVVNFTLFVVVKNITKNIKAAFLSVIIFSTSYIGSFQLVGSGYSYPAFMQRVPMLFLVFFSLIFLNLFIQTTNLKYYFASVFIFFVSMFLAHYNFVLLPVLIIYCFLGVLNRDKTFRLVNLFAAGGYSLFYFFVSYPFVKIQGVTGQANSDLFVFIGNGTWILKEIFHEIAILTVPPEVSKNVSFLVIILFFLTSVLIYIKEKKLRAFWVTLILSIPIIIFMLIYMNYPAFLNTYESNRYFYIPSLLVAMFWAVGLSYLFFKSVFKKFLVVIIVFTWVYYNGFLINRGFKNAEEANNRVLLTEQFIRDKSSTFPDNSLVLVDNKMGSYNVYIMNRFYGRGSMVLFMTQNDDNRETSLKKFKNIIKLNYESGKIEKEVVNRKS